MPYTDLFNNLPPSAQIFAPNTFTGQQGYSQPGVNLPPSAQSFAPNSLNGQPGMVNPQLQAIQAIASIYHPQPRTDAGWGTNNATPAADWAKMFNNTGVLGGTMQSSVSPGTNPGLGYHAAQVAATRGVPMATVLGNMFTNRPSQMNPSYNANY